jgi:C1A family cysteine protease
MMIFYSEHKDMEEEMNTDSEESTDSKKRRNSQPTDNIPKLGNLQIPNLRALPASINYVTLGDFFESHESTFIFSNFFYSDSGKVTSVKNQGTCGACWAFAVCAAAESQLIIKGKATSTINLSEQQLVNCDTLFNQGCNGGWP